MSNATVEKYKERLAPGKTLAVYNEDALIFTSSGKWLHPLFELEQFLLTYTGARNMLCAHDTAVGKAAAVLMVRMGIRRIYADLASSLALSYVQQVNESGHQVALECGHLVDRILCATEEQLEPLCDSDEMYFLLRQRAQLICGVPVSVQGICYPYGNIHGLSFELKAGGHLMVVGENGAGKTTLLRLIAGIYAPSEGRILIDGKRISALPEYTVGYIPQQADDEAVSLSVEEVVTLGIPPHSGDRIARRKIVRDVLTRTSCAHLVNRGFASLSGGEKQKVSIARCLAQHAKLLLLDEPTSALDAENRRMVMDILLSLTVTEIPTIIVVTHDDELTRLRGWDLLRIDGGHAV